MIKAFVYLLQGIGFSILFYGFKLLPPRMASNFGGWMGRIIGPRLAANRKAVRNISRVYDLLSSNECNHIARGMWDNLGRVIAEYPHLKSIAKHHVTIEGAQHLNDLAAKDEQAIFIGAHMSNWELNIIAPYLQHNIKTDITYRPPNNPWVDKRLTKTRTLNGALNAHPKSRQGGMSILKALKANHNIGILIDQKYNEGISAPFFGMDAMTNPVFVQLAQKNNIKIIPVRNIRVDKTSFRLIINAPINTLDSNGNKRSQEEVIADTHSLLESWINEYPAQWLWLHRRWKSKNTKNGKNKSNSNKNKKKD